MKILNYKKKVKEIMEQYPELRGLLYEKNMNDTKKKLRKNSDMLLLNGMQMG